MFRMLFGNLFSAVTTVLVLAMLALIAASFLGRYKIHKWGGMILLFIVVGTAISGFSAMRDAYMTQSALFSPESVQSMVCSVAGGLIFLAGVVSVFVKNQPFRMISFYLISALFLVQVVTVEASRFFLI